MEMMGMENFTNFDQRIKREKEERIRKMMEETERIDALSDEEIMDRATKMLGDLDLSFDDFADKKVVDLGSGAQIIERAATIKGSGTVFSVDSRAYLLSKRPEVKNGIVANIIEGIPQISDDSIDLLISRAGPPTISRKKEHADRSIVEILRMLKSGGKAVIGPIVFNFIEENNDRYQKLLKKKYRDRQELSDSEKDEINSLEKIMEEESVKYLEEKNINVTAIKSKTMNWSYGIITK